MELRQLICLFAAKNPVVHAHAKPRIYVLAQTQHYLSIEKFTSQMQVDLPKQPLLNLKIFCWIPVLLLCRVLATEERSRVHAHTCLNFWENPVKLGLRTVWLHCPCIILFWQSSPNNSQFSTVLGGLVISQHLMVGICCLHMLLFINVLLFELRVLTLPK